MNYKKVIIYNYLHYPTICAIEIDVSLYTNLLVVTAATFAPFSSPFKHLNY